MHDVLRTRVNDFAIKLANVNGTGSASANSLIMQAIFRMGIPVTGKNLFPSNIQGLPTWYEIRVNKDGHTARALEYDLMVAMNGQTYKQDMAEVRPGGYLIYTGQPWHPQLEMIARTLTSHKAKGEPWIMRRRTQLELDQLVTAAGFRKVEQRVDEWGIFTVSVAERI